MRGTRRLARPLVPITITVLAGVGLAAPAHAARWVDGPTFAHPEQCLIAGEAGVKSSSWLDFRCKTISPDVTGPGVIELDVELP